MENKKKNEKLEIQLDEDTAQGVYANLAVVNHTENEFTLDFIYIQPQGQRAKVRSRIVTTPAHIRALIRALQNNLAVYDKKFGSNPDGNPTVKVPNPADEQYH